MSSNAEAVALINAIGDLAEACADNADRDDLLDMDEMLVTLIDDPACDKKTRRWAARILDGIRARLASGDYDGGAN